MSFDHQSSIHQLMPADGFKVKFELRPSTSLASLSSFKRLTRKETNMGSCQLLHNVDKTEAKVHIRKVKKGVIGSRFPEKISLLKILKNRQMEQPTEK